MLKEIKKTGLCSDINKRVKIDEHGFIKGREHIKLKPRRLLCGNIVEIEKKLKKRKLFFQTTDNLR
jgi:hypothetical protein